jgi:preprotein translocase subunit SecA
MTEAIKEETVGYLFNLEVQVAEPQAEVPTAVVVPEGALAVPVDTPAEVEPAQAAPQPERVSRAARTEAKPIRPADAAPPAASADRGSGALIAKGLDAPQQVPLSYSAPSEDATGGAVVTGEPSRRARRAALHGEAVAVESDGRTFPGTPRNAQCPCGSGKKYKVCHGKNEAQ